MNAAGHLSPEENAMRKIAFAALAVAGFVAASTATYAQPKTCYTNRIGNTTVTNCY